MKKILVNYLHNRTINNGIWLYLLQFFNMVIPLFTLPYVTRLLGSYQYGIFSASFNIVNYLQVIVEYGFAMSATREVALKNKNLNEIFSSVIASRLLLFLLCLFISFMYMIFWQPNRQQSLSYWILMISVLAIVFQNNWIFQGLQYMKYITITNVVARTMTTILIFGCVKRKEDLLIYCFFYALSPLISNLIGLIIVKLRFKIKFVKIQLENIINELRHGWYVFTTQVTGTIFNSIGITFLIFLTDNSTVGIYSAIQKIPNIIFLMWNPISQILYPIASKKFNNSFNEGYSFILSVRRYVLIIFVILIFLMIVFAKEIVNLAFGESFAQHYIWLVPLLLWILVSIDNNFWGIQILLGSGHDKEYSFCFQISVVTTVAFSYLFTYLCGGLGAGIAPLVSELILDIMLIRKVKNLRLI